MKTKELTKEQYPSKYHYSAEEYISQLVKKDEVFVDTVVGLTGVAGKPINSNCEVSY